MSNQACLFAEETPAPYNPLNDTKDARTKTLFIAGAAYRIPVFWMFCFAEEDFVEVPLSESKFSTLVAPTEAVRRRLDARDTLARDFFPDHADLWLRWRRVIESIDRSFLKLDPYELWMLCKTEGHLDAELRLALEWFTCRDDYEFTSLLNLAGIEDYDDATRRMLFDEEHSSPERFLIGWLEIDEPKAKTRSNVGRAARKPRHGRRPGNGKD